MQIIRLTSLYLTLLIPTLAETRVTAPEGQMEITVGGNINDPGPRFVPQKIGLKALLTIMKGHSRATGSRWDGSLEKLFPGHVYLWRKDTIYSIKLQDLMIATTQDFEIKPRDVVAYFNLNPISYKKLHGQGAKKLVKLLSQ